MYLAGTVYIDPLLNAATQETELKESEWQQTVQFIKGNPRILTLFQ